MAGSSESSIHDKETTPKEFAYSIVVVFVLTCGFIENMFVVCSILRSKSNTISKKFSANFLFAAAGFCFSATVFIIILWHEGSLTEKKFRLMAEHGILIGLTFGTIHYVASAALSFTRLIALKWPVKYKTWMHHNKSVNVVIFLVWFISILVSIPMFYGYMGQPNPKGFTFTPFKNETHAQMVSRNLYLMFLYGFPIITIVVSYAVMYWQVVKLKRQSNSRGSDQCKKALNQWQTGVTRALMVSIAISSICNGIHFFNHVIEFATDLLPIEARLSFLIYTIQHVLDPIVFIVFCKDYRESAIEIVRLMFCGRPPKCFRHQEETAVSMQTNSSQLNDSEL